MARTDGTTACPDRPFYRTAHWIRGPNAPPERPWAIKKGLTLVNSPGTIDSDYRGEIKLPVINLSQERQSIEPGERVCQMVIARYEQIRWEAAIELSETGRGAGGFGSTGS